MIPLTLAPSGALQAQLPGAEGRKRSVIIPATPQGILTLQRILLAQQRMTKAERKIGTDAAPTQAQVDAWLRAHKPQRDVVDLGDIDL
jgi:hypothetical protein